MDSRMRKNVSSIAHTYHPPVVEGNNIVEDQYQYERSFSKGATNGKKHLQSSYFTMESMLVLVGLTASLLILPLVLPPLPPPPYLLLLVPIGIMGFLVIIALMPSNDRDLTLTYM